MRNVGPELLADRGDDRHKPVRVRRAPDEALRGAEGIELGRLEADPDDILGRLDEGLRSPLRAIPAIGIAEDAVADAAAEQLMDGDAERFAQNVPAGDLDRRDGRAMDMAAIERDAVHQPLRQALMRRGSWPIARCDNSWTAASVVRDETVERALADAVDAVIRMDAHEQPVLPLDADREGFDVG